MAKAMITIREVRRPVSRDLIGYRLVAAEENMAGKMVPAGKDSDAFRMIKGPSFRKPYFICEGSDLPDISFGDIDRFVKQLGFIGWNDTVPVGPLMESLMSTKDLLDAQQIG